MPVPCRWYSFHPRLDASRHPFVTTLFLISYRNDYEAKTEGGEKIMALVQMQLFTRRKPEHARIDAVDVFKLKLFSPIHYSHQQ